MDQKQSHHHGFLNGLIVGFFLGVGVALLFATKKGRKILKAMTEEGLDSVSELKHYLRNVDDVVAEDMEDDIYTPVSPTQTSSDSQSFGGGKPTSSEKKHNPEHHNAKSPARRLFKGVAKKN